MGHVAWNKHYGDEDEDENDDDDDGYQQYTTQAVNVNSV